MTLLVALAESSISMDWIRRHEPYSIVQEDNLIGLYTFERNVKNMIYEKYQIR